ncbi:MAG: hypothetical protein JWO30_442 [Fibrobacteres bacterium]|nr:hypothetical protein [Fibrobacterota bacterium]
MSETDRPRNVMRSIGAVLAGFVAVFVLSMGTDMVLHAAGVYPAWGLAMSQQLFLLATAYRIVYGLVGGYITARLAPSGPMRHAIILGLIGTVVGLVATAATWNKGPEFGPKWYALAIAAIALPCSWAGGRMAARRK